MKSKFQLPSREEAEKYIIELDKIDWKSFEGENIGEYIEKNHQLITGITGVHSHMFLVPHSDVPINFKIFRVREAKSIKNKYLRCEYSYPPIEHSKNLRANLKGFPVFYASDTPLTAVLEYIQQWQDASNYLDKDYVISVWSILEKRKICFAPYFSKEQIGINPIAFLGQFSDDDFRKITNSEVDKTYIDGMRIMKNYFANKFISDEKYSISSYVSFRLMYMNPLYNTIIIYPSKQSNLAATNYAIHPNFADEKMKLERVYRITIKNIEDFGKDNFKLDFQMHKKLLFNHHSILKEADTSSEKNIELFRKYYKDDFGTEAQI